MSMNYLVMTKVTKFADYGVSYKYRVMWVKCAQRLSIKIEKYKSLLQYMNSQFKVVRAEWDRKNNLKSWDFFIVN